jgi:hypothetical protein
MGFSKLRAASCAAFFACVALPRHVEAITGALHFDVQRTLLLARLDPIIAENKASGHMHRIWGGNAFSAAYSQENSLKGNCSTIYAQADMSNYWYVSPRLLQRSNENADNPLHAKQGSRTLCHRKRCKIRHQHLSSRALRSPILLFLGPGRCSHSRLSFP